MVAIENSGTFVHGHTPLARRSPERAHTIIKGLPPGLCDSVIKLSTSHFPSLAEKIVLPYSLEFHVLDSVSRLYLQPSSADFA
jgi:hypothetical protein